MLVDIDGPHTTEDLVERYNGEADDGQAAAGRSTRADCWEWYVESQREPVPLEMAKTFVSEVLALAEPTKT